MRATAGVLIAVAACVTAGCGGYRIPDQLKAVKGDWIADSGGGSFVVLILDPNEERDFNWYERHAYTQGQLSAGASGNFKWEPGRVKLKLPTEWAEYDVVRTGEQELVLRGRDGVETTYRRMTEPGDYDRVDWTVSKMGRLKNRSSPAGAAGQKK